VLVVCQRNASFSKLLDVKEISWCFSEDHRELSLRGCCKIAALYRYQVQRFAVMPLRSPHPSGEKYLVINRTGRRVRQPGVLNLMAVGLTLLPSTSQDRIPQCNLAKPRKTNVY
jgi:hypothetical protein